MWHEWLSMSSKYHLKIRYSHFKLGLWTTETVECYSFLLSLHFKSHVNVTQNESLHIYFVRYETFFSLLRHCTIHFGSVAANTVKQFCPDKLPLLLVISRNRGTNEVMEVIDGMHSYMLGLWPWLYACILVSKCISKSWPKSEEIQHFTLYGLCYLLHQNGIVECHNYAFIYAFTPLPSIKVSKAIALVAIYFFTEMHCFEIFLNTSYFEM